jgi:tetratricopeptide (TPR) repeat protein
MSTVALNMIIKDEFDAVAEIVAQAIDYFDEINLTVSHKPTANKLKKIATATPKVRVQWREWTDRFDEARNANLEMCTADYFFWLDADDEFDFRAIPQLVEIADENNIDAIFLPYNYAQDEDGNCITRHWRERLVRTGRGYTSRGWVHETFITDEPHVDHKVDFEVKHHSTPEHSAESVERNHAILEKAYAETKDPRYLHYLGMSHFTHQEYDKAAELLSEYLEVGGSLDDSYRALAVISESAYHLDKPDIALEYATKCATLKPSYPMAYWLLAQYEADQKNWEEALEWVRVGMSKPDPETLSIFNPEDRTRGILLAAQAEFMLQHYNLALGWLRKIPKNKTAESLYPDFKSEADAETFLNLLPKIRKFFKSDEQLWNALVPDLAYDTRILSFRQMVTAPYTWPENSIVIFCGQGYEEWGPSTLDKGMGGSEEAIVYLAPELAKLGYSVTVYGEVPDVEIHDGVKWYPWKMIDTRDEFNIFVSWRAPQYLEKIKAKVKLCDVHDVLPANIMKDYPDVTYLVKSDYHRGLYPNLADKKFRVIGNGIKKDQFND